MEWFILLTTFSCHLSLCSCHGQIWHSKIPVKVSYCFLVLFSFKMSHWEVLRTLQSLSYWHFPKNVLLTAKTVEKMHISKKVFIVMGKMSLIFLKHKPLKSRDLEIKTIPSMCITFRYVCIM